MDPKATGFLPYRSFWRFFANIHTIYGLSKENFISNEEKTNFLALLNLPVYYHEGTLGFEFYVTI